MIKILKLIWHEPWTYIIRMALVYYLVKVLYLFFNDFDVNWLDELELVGGYIFIFVLVYCFTGILPIKHGSYGPLNIHNEVTEAIEKDSSTFGDLVKNASGLYKIQTKFTDELKNSYQIFTPISNPEIIIAKIDSHLVTLESLDGLGSDTLTKHLNKKREQAIYMLENNTETFTRPYF